MDCAPEYFMLLKKRFPLDIYDETSNQILLNNEMNVTHVHINKSNTIK